MYVVGQFFGNSTPKEWPCVHIDQVRNLYITNWKWYFHIQWDDYGDPYVYSTTVLEVFPPSLQFGQVGCPDWSAEASGTLHTIDTQAKSDGTQNNRCVYGAHLNSWLSMYMYMYVHLCRAMSHINWVMGKRENAQIFQVLQVLQFLTIYHLWYISNLKLCI